MVMVVDGGCSHSKVMLWLKVSLSTGLLYCEKIQSTRPQVTQSTVVTQQANCPLALAHSYKGFAVMLITPSSYRGAGTAESLRAWDCYVFVLILWMYLTWAVAQDV